MMRRVIELAPATLEDEPHVGALIARELAAHPVVELHRTHGAHLLGYAGAARTVVEDADPLFVRVRDFLEWAGDAAYVPHPPEEADVRTLVSVRARALLRELDREAGRE